MPTVFVSYRRSDNPDVATLIYNRLSSRFGHESVYFDIESVPAGVDFRKHIEEAIDQCDVLLVIIGNRWLKADAQGHRRLEDPADYVRIEIETALRRGIPVIPVPVGTATVPSESELPETISELAFRNSKETTMLFPGFSGFVSVILVLTIFLTTWIAWRLSKNTEEAQRYITSTK